MLFENVSWNMLDNESEETLLLNFTAKRQQFLIRSLFSLRRALKTGAQAKIACLIASYSLLLPAIKQYWNMDDHLLNDFFLYFYLISVIFMEKATVAYCLKQTKKYRKITRGMICEMKLVRCSCCEY